MNSILNEFISKLENLRKFDPEDQLISSIKSILSENSNLLRVLNKVFINNYFHQNKNGEDDLLLCENDINCLKSRLDGLNLVEHNAIDLSSKIGDLSLSCSHKLTSTDLVRFEPNEIKVELNVPEDAKPNCCYYCKLDDPSSTIQCLECNIFFCNGKTKGMKTSHILHHLITSKHNQLNFELEVAEGQKKECNLCGCKSILQLGYLSSNKNRRYLVCRVPCKKIVEETLGIKKVTLEKPIDENFEKFFAKIRTVLSSLCIDGEKILRADSKGVQIRLPEVSRYEIVKYEDWVPLVNKDKQIIDSVLSTPSRKNVADFCDSITSVEINNLENKLFNYRKLNSLKLGCPIENLHFIPDLAPDGVKPVLMNYQNGKELKETFLLLLKKERSLQYLTEIDFRKSQSLYERTLNAMEALVTNQNSLNESIYDCLLGKRIITRVDQFINRTFSDSEILALKAPGLPLVNQSQAKSIYHALNNPLTLIQGPPGTGKTLTSAVLVYNLLRQPNLSGKILVCTPSNLANDNIANEIAKTGLKVVRVLSKTKEQDGTYVSPLSIHHQVNRELELTGFCLPGYHRRMRADQLSRDKINEANVVCTTLACAVDKRLAGIKFSTLLVDEVCHSKEPDTMIPLSKSIEKVVLIGDPAQLSPVVLNEDCANAGYNQSVFHRLLANGNKGFMLNMQYRMHPFISSFPSRTFYDGKLKDGIRKEDRELTSKRIFPKPDQPVLFYSIKGKEETSFCGHSYLNQVEAYAIGKIVHKLIIEGIAPKQISIITPYKGQTEFLKVNLRFFCKNSSIYDEVEIASINAYQGRENDIIIFSTVRSNLENSIGFLKDEGRLNVALTRAKYGLIIVGDATTLSSDSMFLDLLNFLRDNNLIYSGEIGSLKVETNYRFKEIESKPADKSCVLKSNYYKKVEVQNNDGTIDVKYEKINFSA